MGILDGKVAIVTGAGKGLGEAEAVCLAREGATVTVCSRTLAGVQRVAKRIEEEGGRALALACEVRKRDDVKRVVAETVKKFGTVTIMLNNAQIMPASQHPMEEWTEQEMRDAWESGLLGSWFFMVECLPHIKAVKYGKIINTCSAAGHGNVPQLVGYSTTKEATRSLTRCGAREWGKYGMTVNTLSPVAMTSAGERRRDL